MPRPDALTRNRAQRRLATDQPGGFKGLGKTIRKLDAMDANLLPELGALMYESIVHGSRLTGAPGQPEQEGDLVDSWQAQQPTPTSVAVTSNSPYALQNEDGVRPGGRPYVQRSAVGGRHSVKLTRQGLPRLVEEAVKRTTERVA